MIKAAIQIDQTNRAYFAFIPTSTSGGPQGPPGGPPDPRGVGIDPLKSAPDIVHTVEA